MEELGKHKEDEDPREREERHVSFEHKLIVEGEVSQVHSYVKYAH